MQRRFKRLLGFSAAILAVVGFMADAHATTTAVNAIDDVDFIADNDNANAGTEDFSFTVSGQQVLSMSSDNTIAQARDNYTINFDVDNGGGGVFSVVDFDGGGASVTTLSMDAASTTIDSDAITLGSTRTGNVSIRGTLDMTQSNVNNVQDLEVEGNTTLGDANTDTTTVRGLLHMNDGNSNNITLDENGGSGGGGSMVLGTSAGATRLTLDGGASTMTFADADSANVTIGGDSGTNGSGVIQVGTSAGTTSIAINGEGGTGNGGLINVNTNTGDTGVRLDGGNSAVMLRDANSTNMTLDADAGTGGGALINVGDSSGTTKVAIDGGDSKIQLNDADTTNILLDADAGTASGSLLSMRNAAGTSTVSIDGGASTVTAGGSTNGTMAVRNSANELTVNLLGGGSSAIADGLTVGSAGTAAAVDGHLMVVDGTSARLVSDNATNSIAVNDTNTTITNTTGTNSIIVANDAVQAIGANNFTYGTRVNGGMFVDGDLGVNGNIYTLNNSANATVQVANNGLDITGATNTVGLTADNNASAADARARLALTPTTASLLVNTDSGVGHGISITQSNTVISGGTNSTTLTLDDSGATFQNTSTGGPARVTGVADGTSDFDAVNYRQLRGFADTAYSGIATAHALSAIPSPAPGKSFAVGGGYGYFEDKHAFALGGSAIVTENIVVKGGWGYSNESSSANGGVAYSF